MRFEIVFRGRIASGFGAAEVRTNLARLFRTTEERIERLFSGNRMVLKTGLDRPTADKYRDALRHAGAVVSVVSVREETPEPVSEPETAPPQAPPPAAKGTPESAPANRAVFTPAPGPDAAPTNRAVFTPAPGPDAEPQARAVFTPAPGPDAPPGTETARHASPEDEPAEDGGLTLAAPGAVLLPPAERAPRPSFDLTSLALDEPGAIMDGTPKVPAREFDTAHLTAEQATTPLDASPPAPPPPIDLSGLEMGDDEGPVDDTPRPPQPEIDTSAFSAEVSETPLDAKPKAVAPEFDLSELALEDDPA